mmetsp:Transcript_18858/g.26754  ORF Transcript_18858/g.26754 Transcript_18858/m.26754 type:complete len:133 (+) Transcript_18858:239-637(+)
MIKTAAIIAPAFLLIYHIILPLALVSSTNVKAQNRRRIASNEEAIEVRRRLQSVNLDAIPSITETATEVLIDPVMGPWPQCVGMQADDCIALIEVLAADIYTVVVLPVEPERTRVRVSVDETGKVNRVPHRG